MDPQDDDPERERIKGDIEAWKAKQAEEEAAREARKRKDWQDGFSADAPLSATANKVGGGSEGGDAPVEAKTANFYAWENGILVLYRVPAVRIG